MEVVMNHSLKIPLCVIASLLRTLNAASADVIAYDGFGNGPLPDIGGSNGGTGWSSPWQDINSSMQTAIVMPGLSFGQLKTTPGAAVTPSGGSFDAATYYRAIAPYSAPENKVYVSFLLRQDAGFGSFAGLTFGNYPTGIWVGSPLGYYTYGFMIGDGLIVDTGMDVIQGQTTLLVFEMEKFDSPAYTQLRLFVNPDPAAPQPKYDNAHHAWGGPLPTSMQIKNDGGYTTDEIRVGTTWQSVLPLQCPADVSGGGNGVVDVDDLLTVINNWGDCPAPCAADIMLDGVVDVDDLLAVINAWGACP
jgi:hypothetical protein